MSQTLPIEIQLPDPFVAEIGKIITHWAYVEWHLRQVAYRVLEISPKVGRIAVREQREPEFLDTIVELMKLNKLSIPTEAIKKLRTGLVEYGWWRNVVAHCLWVKNPKTNTLMAQLTTGQWDKSKLDPGQKLSRKILPEGLPVELKTLKEVDRGIAGVAMSVEAFWQNVHDQLLTLREKSPQPSHDPDRHLDHVAQKHPTPPRSSRA